MPPTIALIGLGLLGSALADRLIAAGYSVRGFDVDPAPLAALARGGGFPACSAREAANGAEKVLTCLMTAAVVREAVLGPEGAAGAMAPGAVLVDLTTCAPAESRALAAELARRGISTLDAPVSGSSAAARTGEVVVLAGGPAEVFEACRPLFMTFAREALYLGESGAGCAAKLVTNLVLGLNRLALAEGIALGLQAGLEPDALLHALRESAAYSRALDAKGERMIHRRFEPEARLGQHLKDVRLILALAEELGVRLPTSQLHERLLQDGVERGLAELDNSAVIELFRGS
jgi:3-hydroxyisobutyrate dehydrogenase-like beta-hydroxyacid dehydrogenase